MLKALLRKLTGRDPAREALMLLYRQIVATARRPIWYREGGVPDTIDGRFDMVSAILTLVLLRLEDGSDATREPSARLTEIFIDDMDSQLRQEGIGDLLVGKHVGRLMSMLGGRLGAFRDGLAEGGDLDGAIARNLLRAEGGASPAHVAVLRDGLLAFRAALAATPVGELLDGALEG